MEEKKYVVTGVFWVVNGKIVADKKMESTSNARSGEWVDYRLSHYAVWDKLTGGKYQNADFATYPRERLLYNVKEGGYVLYADRCVTEENVVALEKFFGIENQSVRVARDEHYSCAGCNNERKENGAGMPEAEPIAPQGGALEARVLRGENELTGNLIEISNGFVDILVELGENLSGNTGEQEKIENYVLTKHFDAVIISH